MKRAIAIVFVLVAAGVCGCSSVNCSRSDTAEYPTVEKWWK